MNTIDNFNFSGKKALIRVDFNVPLNDKFEVTDDTRISASIPSIKKILNDGGAVILMSHLGRPKDGPEEKFSLKHTISTLEKLVGTTIHFANDCIGKEAKEKAAQLKSGEILLLENLRFYTEETKGDVVFAEKLAKLGDVYVNDAFGTAHRAHASTAIIAQFFPHNKYFGYLLAKEIESVSKVLKNNIKPVTAIVGGAKVSSKIIIIENLLDSIDNLIIGGGMVFTFIKALGGNIGNSLVEDDFLATAKEILEKAKAKNVTVFLPEDSVASTAFNNESEVKIFDTNDIP